MLTRRSALRTLIALPFAPSLLARAAAPIPVVTTTEMAVGTLAMETYFAEMAERCMVHMQHKFGEKFCVDLDRLEGFDSFLRSDPC